MKTNLFRIPYIAIILTLALSGCSSTPEPEPEQTFGVAAPASRSSALAGTWKLAAENSPSQVLQFQNDGTGTFTLYDAQGQVKETSEIRYDPDDDARFGRISKEWVIFVPCEVQGDKLTLTSTGEVFTKE